MQNNRLLFCALVALALIGCSDDKKVPLKGERISVLQMKDSLAVDEAAAEKPVELAAARANTAWPQAGGNAAHAPIHIELNGKDIKRVWQASIGEGSEKRRKLITAPIVAYDRVFTADTEGFVSAFSLKDGKKLWRVNVLADDDDLATVSSGLAFAMGTLFVTDGINRVLALDPANGQKKWEINTPSAVRGSLTFNSGRLYIVTLDDQTLALNPTNGETLWKHQGVTEGAGLLGAPSPAAQDSAVISAYSSGDIVALRPETGSEAWDDNLTGVAEAQSRAVTKLSGFRGHPVIDGDHVIVGNAATRLVAIHIPSGERVWQKEFGSTQTPWVAGNMIYVVTPQNELVGLFKDTGAVRWVRQLARFEDPDDKEDPVFWSGPVLAGDRLWVASSDKTLLAIDPATGKDVSKTSVPHGIMLPPVVVDNTLLLLTDTGELQAYR